MINVGTNKGRSVVASKLRVAEPLMWPMSLHTEAGALGAQADSEFTPAKWISYVVTNWSECGYLKIGMKYLAHIYDD